MSDLGKGCQQAGCGITSCGCLITLVGIGLVVLLILAAAVTV